MENSPLLYIDNDVSNIIGIYIKTYKSNQNLIDDLNQQIKKSLIKSFYNILLFCENYKNQTNERKASFLTKHLSINTNNKNGYISDLVRYFNKYQAFCFDLSPDSVLKPLTIVSFIME